MRLCDCCSFTGRFHSAERPSSRVSPSGWYASSDTGLTEVGDAPATEISKDDLWRPDPSAYPVVRPPPTAQVPLPGGLLPASSTASMEPMLVKDQRPQPFVLKPRYDDEVWQVPRQPLVFSPMGQQPVVTSSAVWTIVPAPACAGGSFQGEPNVPHAVRLSACTGPVHSEVTHVVANMCGALAASPRLHANGTASVSHGPAPPTHAFPSDVRPMRPSSSCYVTSPLLGGPSSRPQSRMSSPTDSRTRRKKQSMVEAQKLVMSMLASPQPMPLQSPMLLSLHESPACCSQPWGHTRPSPLLGGSRSAGGAPSAAAAAAAAAAAVGGCPPGGRGCRRPATSPTGRVSPLCGGRNGGMRNTTISASPQPPPPMSRSLTPPIATKISGPLRDCSGGSKWANGGSSAGIILHIPTGNGGDTGLA